MPHGKKENKEQMEDLETKIEKQRAAPLQFSMKPNVEFAQNHEAVETWGRLEENIKLMKS